MRHRLLIAACGAAALATTVAVSVGGGASAHQTQFRLTSSLQGIHKIKHIVVVLQENRSFDSYFGTYPGARGLPTVDGALAVSLARLPGGADGAGA